MSSLAATCADGYYTSPAWPEDMNKTGNRSSKKSNNYSNSNSNSKNDNTIRFALPYDGICEICGYFLTRGLRFNAIKHDTGRNYLNIKIYEFQNLKCIECRNTFIITTDPQNSSYIYGPGVKIRHKRVEEEQEQEEDDEEDYDKEKVFDNNNNSIVNINSMKKLENIIQGKNIKIRNTQEIEYLHEKSKRLREDDFIINKKLRDIHRNGRKEIQKLDEERLLVGLPQHIPLLPVTTITTTTTTTTATTTDNNYNNNNNSNSNNNNKRKTWRYANVDITNNKKYRIHKILAEKKKKKRKLQKRIQNPI